MAITQPEGKCAVVTGGGGLIGRALVMTFAGAGMDVVVADKNIEAAQAVAREGSALGVRAIPVQTDVADLGSVMALAERAHDEFGAVHLLCNNAGRVVLGDVWELTADDWNAVLSSHLGGVVNGLLAFLPRLLAQSGERHIVNTSSMSGIGLGALRPTQMPYTAAKFAITGISESLAPALAPHGIGVSVLCPGLVSDDPHPTFLTPSGRFYQDEVVPSRRVGEMVLRAVRDNNLHIFTHATSLWELNDRNESILQSFRLSGLAPLPTRPTA